MDRREICVKKLFILPYVLSLILPLTSCTQAPNKSKADEVTGGMSLASFYYEEDVARYQNADIVLDGFVNTDPHPISDQIEAEERAKSEVTIEYTTISDYRDADAGMWRIDFFTLERTDDGLPIISNIQKVYLDDNGITQLIVYEDE